MSQENQTTPCPICGLNNWKYHNLDSAKENQYYQCPECLTEILSSNINKRFSKPTQLCKPLNLQS